MHNKNTRIRKKERIFGFWFNTKHITYEKIPSSFFIAASSKIDNILPISTLIKEELSFDYVLENKISNRNFISNDSQNIWKKNFVRLKKKFCTIGYDTDENRINSLLRALEWIPISFWFFLLTSSKHVLVQLSKNLFRWLNFE